jgi:hemerythrin-like domain-containing protein
MTDEITEFWGRGIKQIIDEYPDVGAILESYDIGCVPCSLGTCRLSDVVEIHNLDPALEQEMMTRIVKKIYPDRDITIPLRERKTAAASNEIRYSPPMKMLVQEHELIKRLLALVPSLINSCDLESESGRQVIRDAVDFVRSYADKFHHAKEEDILFKYFDAELDILKVMHNDHETGRAHVKAVLEAVEKRDRASASEHLNGYRELLTEHIKKEDEILYPWMDRELSDRQIGQLYSQFNETDETFGDAPKKYEHFISKLEEQFA